MGKGFWNLLIRQESTFIIDSIFSMSQYVEMPISNCNVQYSANWMPSWNESITLNSAFWNVYIIQKDNKCAWKIWWNVLSLVKKRGENNI